MKPNIKSKVNEVMNLKRIQAFILVLEKESFSEAAQVLNLTQPAVSQQIKTLENELKTALLERSSASIVPTPAGLRVYEAGKKMLAIASALEDELLSFQDKLSGHLNIGASTIPGTYILPKLLGFFNEQYPDVKITLTIGNSREMIERVKDRSVDLCVIGCTPPESSVTVKNIATDALILIGPKQHSDDLSIPDDLRHIPFVLREKGSGTRETMESALSQLGVQPENMRIMAQFSTTESLIAAVENGLGFSFTSELAARLAIKAGRVREFTLPISIQRQFCMVYLTTRKEHPLLQAFLRTLQCYFHDLPPAESCGNANMPTH
jgi:DNA-binding transcriptional LysR family regulator